jgi:hypothetical protein
VMGERVTFSSLSFLRRQESHFATRRARPHGL